jgi:ABC-type Fe3+/spermidine/putrescine transport system ATPase subunit
VAEAIELVCLGDLKDRSVSALSGGQQQRVALARGVKGPLMQGTSCSTG